MKVSPVLLAASLVLVMSGCAQPQPAVTDDPVATAPSEEAPAPDAKPTAASGASCFEATYAVAPEEEQHGGEVTWPAPLTDDAFGVEPSCWIDVLDSERNLFLAGWYGLDDAQYDSVNTPIEQTLADAGYQLEQDTNGVSVWGLDEPETPSFQITRTDGFYELAVTVGHG